MSWLLLVVAGLFEVAWTIGLEYSDGFSKPLSTLGTAVALVVSMVLLAGAVRALPIGTAYAVWTGIGAVGTAMLGILVLDEPATVARVGFISVIVLGIVGLHAVSGGSVRVPSPVVVGRPAPGVVTNPPLIGRPSRRLGLDRQSSAGVARSLDPWATPSRRTSPQKATEATTMKPAAV
jgi:quaternary ammonium compound-resistance protein SugE